MLVFLRDLTSPALFEMWFAGIIAMLLLFGAMALGLLVMPQAAARPAVRALAGFPLFFLFGGTLGIVVYLAGGTVRIGLVTVLVLSVGTSALCTKRLLRTLSRPRNDQLLLWGHELALLVGLLLVGFLLAFFGWGETNDGTIRAMSGAWGDGPLHTLNAEAFRIRHGPDLSFPAFAGESFHEPFGYDFVAAMLREAGFTVGGAFALPAAGLLACLLGVAAHLAGKFGSAAKRFLSIIVQTGILLFGFGGLQWAVMAFRNKTWSPGVFFGIHQPAWAKIEELGLVWDSHLNTFSSQKHLLLAAAFLLVLVMILLESYQRPPRETPARTLLIFSIATGMLPLFHTHGFLAAGLIWLTVFALTRSRQVFWLGILALVLAFPTILWQARLFGREGFLSFTPGWMGGGVFGWIALWAINLGVFLPLIAIAARRAVSTKNRSALIALVPAGALFVLANVVQFQPYRWDNFKLFLLAWLLLLPLVVAEMNRWRFVGASIAGWGLVFVMSLTTLADLATHFRFRATYPVYTSADRAVGRRLDAELPRDAVVLAHTDTAHNHPLTLIGRTLVAGYGGWLWTRNYAWAERSALLDAVWSAEPAQFCALAARFGITHVVDDIFRVRTIAAEC